MAAAKRPKNKRKDRKITNEKPVSLWGPSLREVLEALLRTNPNRQELSSQSKKGGTG